MPRQKTADYVNLFHKECIAVKDSEKSKILKQLLKDTMENHTTISSINANDAESIENKTKQF